MIEKIKELRKIIPIPMGEAKELLAMNDGDVEKCLYLFKTNSIRQICDLTGCDKKMANEHYEIEKFDFNRTVSSIREAIYDQNYKPIEGLKREDISLILGWLRIIETDDFGVSLDYQYLDKALNALTLIPEFSEIASIIRKALNAKNEIFEGYKDSDSIEEFVRRHKQLDDNKDFLKANEIISLSRITLKEEILRHARNIQHQIHS